MAVSEPLVDYTLAQGRHTGILRMQGANEALREHALYRLSPNDTPVKPLLVLEAYRGWLYG